VTLYEDVIGVRRFKLDLGCRLSSLHGPSTAACHTSDLSHSLASQGTLRGALAFVRRKVRGYAVRHPDGVSGDLLMT